MKLNAGVIELHSVSSLMFRNATSASCFAISHFSRRKNGIKMVLLFRHNIWVGTWFLTGKFKFFTTLLHTAMHDDLLDSQYR